VSAEATRDRVRFGWFGGIGEEAHFPGVEGVPQLPREQPAEQPPQHAHRQEETGATSDPVGTVKRGPAAGNDAMDVRMMLQGLAPGMENHGDAELGAKMPGIGRDGGERLGGDTEQDRIDGSLILEGELADRPRCRSDDMKGWQWQQAGLPICEPLHPRQPLAFGTVTVAAGVVSDARCATIIALFDMAAERGRSAGRDGAQDAPLDAPEMPGVRLSKRCAMA